MSEQPKTKAPAPENSSEMEYVYDAVPQSARKSVGSILVILTGYTISLSNFVTGATVGFKMPFKEAVLACAVGNLMLSPWAPAVLPSSPCCWRCPPSTGLPSTPIRFPT